MPAERTYVSSWLHFPSARDAPSQACTRKTNPPQVAKPAGVSVASVVDSLTSYRHRAASGERGIPPRWFFGLSGNLHLVCPWNRPPARVTGLVREAFTSRQLPAPALLYVQFSEIFTPGAKLSASTRSWPGAEPRKGCMSRSPRPWWPPPRRPRPRNDPQRRFGAPHGLERRRRRQRGSQRAPWPRRRCSADQTPGR